MDSYYFDRNHTNTATCLCMYKPVEIHAKWEASGIMIICQLGQSAKGWIRLRCDGSPPVPGVKVKKR